MTLAELIERHHAAQQPTPISDAAVLTAFGHTVWMIGRLERQMRALDPAERAYCAELLGKVCGERPATA